MLGNIENFLKNKVTYLRMTSLILKLINYSTNQCYEFRKDLEDAIMNAKDEEFNLPSGLVGNSLALALELGYYDGALLMIMDNKKFGIDINECAKDNSLNETYSARELFDHLCKLDEDTKIEIPDSINVAQSNAKDVIKKVLV